MMTTFPSEEEGLTLPGEFNPPAEFTKLCRRGHKLTVENTMYDRGYEVCKQCRRLREPLTGRNCVGKCGRRLVGGSHKLCLDCMNLKPKPEPNRGPHRLCNGCQQRRPLNTFRVHGTGKKGMKVTFRLLCNECVGEGEFPPDSPWEMAIARVNELTGLQRDDWWPDQKHPLHQLWYAYAIECYEKLPIKHSIKHPGVAELLAHAHLVCRAYLLHGVDNA